MLGEDGRPFKTRSGGTIRLSDLLDDAVARAREVVAGRDFSDAERAAIAQAVGIGAVKYADLSTSRQRDLVFSFDRMLALDGNTAPYLLYAHVRAAAIVARSGETPAAVTTLAEPAERALVLKLARFGDALAEVEDTLEPHRLCTYLYELAGAFTGFYEATPVLKAAHDDERRSRLALCALTARDARDWARAARDQRCPSGCERGERVDARAESSAARPGPARCARRQSRRRTPAAGGRRRARRRSRPPRSRGRTRAAPTTMLARPRAVNATSPSASTVSATSGARRSRASESRV